MLEVRPYHEPYNARFIGAGLFQDLPAFFPSGAFAAAGNRCATALFIKEFNHRCALSVSIIIRMHERSCASEIIKTAVFLTGLSREHAMSRS